MKRAPLRKRLTYWFNNLLSQGTTTLIVGLFLFTLIVVIIIGLITMTVEEHASGISSLMAIWQSFNHTLDAGTLAGDDGSVPFIALMTIATIFGLIFTSTLVGIINNGISSRLETLDKGRSLVLEEGHTIILGFNDTTLSIIRELLLSNLNQRHCCIVVMDDRDKTEMADAIHDVWHSIRRTHKTQLKPRFACRSGRIDSPLDIAICSPATSKSIIINTTADCMTVKAMLASSRCLETEAGTTGAPETFICAVALQKEGVAPLRIAGNHIGEVLYFKSILARMTAQTIRRPGISKIFSHLLDFEGNEIYIEHVDTPQDAMFGQVSKHPPA